MLLVFVCLSISISACLYHLFVSVYLSVNILACLYDLFVSVFIYQYLCLSTASPL